MADRFEVVLLLELFDRRACQVAEESCCGISREKILRDEELLETAHVFSARADGEGAGEGAGWKGAGLPAEALTQVGGVTSCASLRECCEAGRERDRRSSERDDLLLELEDFLHELEDEGGALLLGESLYACWRDERERRARDDDTNGECKRDAFPLWHRGIIAYG